MQQHLHRSGDSQTNDNQKSQLRQQPKPRHSIPLRLNKNFLNYPLARSPRTKPRWKNDTQGGYCYAALSGDNRIELRLPERTPPSQRRFPTAFDMNVLFVLLAMLQQRHYDGPVIELASRNTVLGYLGLSRHGKHYDRLDDSLAFWSRLTIHFASRWYQHQQHGKPAKRSAHTLPPPIEELVTTGRHSVAVTINKRWHQLALAKEYFEMLPLPLPADATAQNCVLMMLSRATTALVQEAERRGGRWLKALWAKERVGQRWFCNKLGIRNEVTKLVKLTAVVKDWFEQHGGEVFLMCGSNPDGALKPGQVLFGVRPPNVRGWKTVQHRKGQSAAPEGSTEPKMQHRKGQSAAPEGAFYKNRYEQKEHEVFNEAATRLERTSFEGDQVDLP